MWSLHDSLSSLFRQTPAARGSALSRERTIGMYGLFMRYCIASFFFSFSKEGDGHLLSFGRPGWWPPFGLDGPHSRGQMTCPSLETFPLESPTSLSTPWGIRFWASTLLVEARVFDLVGFRSSDCIHSSPDVISRWRCSFLIVSLASPSRELIRRGVQ